MLSLKQRLVTSSAIVLFSLLLHSNVSADITDSTLDGVIPPPIDNHFEVRTYPFWEDVQNKPVTATRWPNFNEVTDKPTFYPTTWSEIDGKPEFFTPEEHDHDGRYIRTSGHAGMIDGPDAGTFYTTRGHSWESYDDLKNGIGGIVFRNTPGPKGGSIWGSIRAYDGVLRLGGWHNGTHDVLNIRTSGPPRIGIGTDDPQATLHIDKGAVYPHFPIDTSTPPDVRIQDYWPRGLSMATIGEDHGGPSAGWPVRFGGILTVGIYNQMPFQLLKGKSRFHYDGTVDSDEYRRDYLYMRSCAGHHSGGVLGGCEPWMRIISENPDGRVGIGVYNPKETLHVGGNVRADAYNIPSDRRLKKDIVPIANASHKLEKLTGVTYRWKEEGEDLDVHLGLIAQDVQRVFPEAVHEDEDGYLTVNYPVLVAPLVESNRELNKRLSEVEDKVLERDERLLQMESEMARLRSLVEALTQ